MKITTNAVVSMHYTLTDNDGTVLDSSQGNDPLVFLHGAGQLIPGMEEGLEGRTAGEKLQLKVAPEKGYGLHDANLVQEIPVEAFNGQEVQPGMQFEAGSQEQRFIVTVTAVSDSVITVDGNHPLAGKELNFDIEIMSVREANADELAHGHAHGADGHHHH